MMQNKLSLSAVLTFFSADYNAILHYRPANKPVRLLQSFPCFLSRDIRQRHHQRGFDVPAGLRKNGSGFFIG